ncbi:hypothetical protein MGG_01764 [Pyricularia oryzae 70-15]|nr:uncharacterized protein MGG_01764 [Pyricularia oryzae 70-15]ELQ41185.1 hypothetical protein OOU_Y34scaffold00295g25 [Pyricularia oryzae Y34]KAI7917726.1 hypothetical protein M0657_007904 [Pyricularia oryzae]EHA54958.1 hypothetical protein MGG_01764 [Pyricularia oryzae 70-15]KAI7921003.1 hypothetical protein M9X92_005613 [Pyricularia oryzae]QBZ56606.1 hypothetical protein PoMZ_01516 [Pyricularia oryzae]
MGAWKILTTLMLLGLGGQVNAKPSFKNNGTLDGWDGQSLEKGTQGTITESTSSVFNGDTSLKMTQTYLPDYTGRYHAEVYKKDGYVPGDSKFYGFAFRLEEKWQFDKQSFNLAQFIADFTGDSKGCDDWMPSTMVWMVGDQLKTRTKTGDICNQKTTSFDAGKVKAGFWHTVVLEAAWHADDKGLLRMWLDGNPVLNKTGVPTTIEDTKKRAFSFRVGLYANGWHDDKKLVGNQKTRQVWYDEIAMGDTYEDVEPRPDKNAVQMTPAAAKRDGGVVYF